MTQTVEYCLSSCPTDLERLIDVKRVEIRKQRCLQHCGICRRWPFVIIDGKVVIEPDASLLMQVATEIDSVEEF